MSALPKSTNGIGARLCVSRSDVEVYFHHYARSGSNFYKPKDI